ncbi:MAG: peptidoglycan-binding domain-containing protein [Cyanobacteria bacterium P01_D01_bin.128]
MDALPNYEEESRKHQHKLMCDEDILPLAWEYARLSTQKSLSETDGTRLEEILNQAQHDGVLDFWINEIDHFLDHELRLVTGKVVYPVETQKLKDELLEHLNLDSRGSKLIDSLNEDGNITIDVIPSKIQVVQASLKRHGLYLGPIDGIVGSRTKEALVTFQKKHNLEPSGVVDGTTIIACEAV